MIVLETPEFTDILDRITSWPPEIRIRLARRVLESVESAPASHARRPGSTAAEVIALLQMPNPLPTMPR